MTIVRHIGWIGVGRMGTPMVERLLKAGHDVSIWNRTRVKAEPLAAKGAKLVDKPIDLAGCDIVFAIDSVPAIFALTREPMIVFTSNVFAILGLRTLYFLLAGAVEKFTLLKYGLAAVLVFVGLKMVWLNELFGGKFPIGWSLGIIGAAIGISIAASLLLPAGRAKDEVRRAA